MYSKNRADKAINFISRLKHTKGIYAGCPFQLEPFQKKIIKHIFGNVDKKKNRIVKTAYIEIPRKNGKSELAAPIALYLLFADKEKGAEIYGAAADSEQASIVFNVAMQMVRQEPALAKRCKILESTKRIILNSDLSSYRVLSADHSSKHGFNAHGVIFDELHAQPNRKLWDVLTTSGGTRTQPLIFAITTSGYDKHSICYEQHEYAKKILKGLVKDESFYPVIYTVSDPAKWEDEREWHRANPALGKFRSIEEMRIAFKKAKEIIAYQNTFKRLYLNIWTAQHEKWLDIAKWDSCKWSGSISDLEGRECYAGLDLASTQDIAAVVLVFPIDDLYVVLPFFWCPEEGIAIRSDRDRVPYQVWEQEGFLNATEGNVIDYRFIRKKINELGKLYNIRQIAFDRWGATEIIQYLQDDGFEVVEVGQGTYSMTAPLKQLGDFILQRRIQHTNHPVLNWMADNLAVKTDHEGKMRPDRKKSSEKIDGMVALLMALSRAIHSEGASIYEERGILTL